MIINFSQNYFKIFTCQYEILPVIWCHMYFSLTKDYLKWEKIYSDFEFWIWGMFSFPFSVRVICKITSNIISPKENLKIDFETWYIIQYFPQNVWCNESRHEMPFVDVKAKELFFLLVLTPSDSVHYRFESRNINVSGVAFCFIFD